METNDDKTSHSYQKNEDVMTGTVFIATEIVCHDLLLCEISIKLLFQTFKAPPDSIYSRVTL